MMFFRNHAEKIFDWIVSLFLLALVALVFTQVVSRYLFNSPISWTEEMARILFVWICFMGTFLALKKKGHIAVETLLNRLFSAEARSYVSAIADFLILYYCIYLAFMGFVMIKKTAEDLTPVLLLPFSYLYAAIALSGTVMALYLVIRVFSLERKKLIVSFLVSIALGGLVYFIFGRGGFSGGNLVAVMLVSFALFIVAGMPIAFAIGIGSTQFLLLYQQGAPRCDPYPPVRRDRLLSPVGRALLHPRRRVDEYRRSDPSARGPGQGSGGSCPRRSGNGRGGGGILFFRNLRLDSGRRLGDCFAVDSGHEKGRVPVGRLASPLFQRPRPWGFSFRRAFSWWSSAG